MNVFNNSCGAVAIFFNPEDNPGLFQKGNSYILKRFDLYGRRCVLISEGKKVSLVSNLGMKKEKELLSVHLPSEIEKNINSLVLKWYNNRVSIQTDSITSMENDYLRNVNLIGEICNA